MLIRRVLCTGLLGMGLAVSAGRAQETGDQARLTLGVGLGVVGGRDLWLSGPQPVQFIVPADTFLVARRIRSTLAVSFYGTYFTGENLGFGGEVFLIGLGFEDGCRQLFSSGSGDVAAVCQSIQGARKSATSVALSAGPILRFNSRKPISPYLRANLGLVISTHSALRTTGTFPTDSGPETLTIYSDNRNSRLDPSLALGLGITASIAKGYNLRWEVRDNITGVQRVTGTIPIAGFVPPHKRVFKHLFSMMVGFDVVLERKRGRRY
ncbi:MAG TPA: hypothetical protein VF252_05115 [Gemmatimonadales bacterium]